MGTFKIIKQPKVDAEFQIMRVYSSTKKLIDKMSEMTGMKKAHLIHQMVLCCMEVSKVVGVDPANLRDLARENPGSLGFPVICAGRAVRIPRLAFIRFMEGSV